MRKTYELREEGPCPRRGGGRLLSHGSSEHVSHETHPQDHQSDVDVRLCKGLKILASADARGR